MKKSVNKGNRTVTWILRILLILVILFWALFSLEAFQYAKGFWDILTAFLMQNIPVFAMIIILIIAWKREHIGGLLLMLCIAGLAAYFMAGPGGIELFALLVMVGIPFLIGAMFVVNHYLLGKKKAVNNTTLS
jgi:hypothetical protein